MRGSQILHAETLEIPLRCHGTVPKSSIGKTNFHRLEDSSQRTCAGSVETDPTQPSCQVDSHRPLGKDHRLSTSLSQLETHVMQDYTLRYGGNFIKSHGNTSSRLRGQSVPAEPDLDGRLLVRAAQ